MSSQKLVHSLTANAVSTNNLQVGGNFNLTGITVVSPKPGSSVTLGLASPGIIVAPAGSLTAATLVFPSHPVNGQVMYISFSQDVGKLTFANGKFANTSLLGPSASAGDSITLFYHADTAKWYKLAGGTTPSKTLSSPPPPKHDAPVTNVDDAVSSSQA
jgi:hypothetical protein